MQYRHSVSADFTATVCLCRYWNDTCAVGYQLNPEVASFHLLVTISRAYSKRVFGTNCALRIKKCAPRISSGIYFLSTS